jgi:hypothetical protein
MAADHHNGPPEPRRPLASDLILLAFVATVGALAGLRAGGVIGWPWALVLAPFTIAGVVFVCGMLAMQFRPRLEWLRDLFGPAHKDLVTPAPDHLEPPLAGTGAGQRILVEHPELLAALCHGFRMCKLRPTVLGRPVTDPWGVYAAATLASADAFQEIELVARLHVQRFATRGRQAMGRMPSDAQVMKRAVDAFRRCAARSGSDRANADCPFEHVTVVFGSRSPNRDEHLKSIAPKVRALLERQYPQLATGRLADGSAIRYTEWQQQVAHSRKELDRLRKEHERLARKYDETLRALADARTQVDTLAAGLDSARQQAQETALARARESIQARQAALEREQQAHARSLRQFDAERERLLASIEALSAERDAIEHALFAADDVAETGPPIAPDALTGLRVLLVGGNEGYLPPIREHLHGFGVQLLHEDGPGATEHVAGVHVVVLWTRYLNHPTYFAVKRECRLRGVPLGFWMSRSPGSLLAVIMEARSGVEAATSDVVEAM